VQHRLSVRLQLSAVAALIAGCSAPPAPIPAPTKTTAQAPLVDSHVHLTFYPVGADLVRAGISTVVDLGAPIESLDEPAPQGLRMIRSGPMLTSPGGYPLDSWGEAGYGIGCADEAAVKAAVERLAKRGAQVIKIAGDWGGLDFSLFETAVVAAHEHQLKVVVHALGDRSALLAAEAGVDVLAHTPVEPLADETVEAWRGRAVISTLSAFGGEPSAVRNLRRLRAAGVTVLYGTDLGNTRDVGISEEEVRLLREVGLDDEEISQAMTTAPAKVWGL
jgi:histidinol phosphatase-like PHP family hydrolase